MLIGVLPAAAGQPIASDTPIRLAVGSDSTADKDTYTQKARDDLQESERKLHDFSERSEAKGRILGHVLVDNRHGLVVDAETTLATGTAEGEAAVRFASRLRRRGRRRATLAGDKGYDQRGVAEGLREQDVTPHVAQRHGD